MATQDTPPEDIPSLKTAAPAIFVPTDRDFTKTPPPLSDDPTARLNASLEVLDWHAAHVENNMIQMCLREADRIRRVAEQQEDAAATSAATSTPTTTNTTESKQSQQHQQQVNYEPPTLRNGNDLLLEERMLEEDAEAVSRILREAKYQDNNSNEDSSNNHSNRSRAPAAPRARGPDDPEYTPLATLREKKMFRTPVSPHQTPREEALTHILNLVKWGWDEQLAPHRAVVQKEKGERRFRHMAMLEGQNQNQNQGDEGAAGVGGGAAGQFAQLASAPRALKRMRVEAGGDRMDVDGA